MPSSENNPTSEYQKLLPWLVNGTLQGEEKQQLEQAISESEELKKEYDELLGLSNLLKSQELPDVPLEFAWQRMQRDISSAKRDSIETNTQTSRPSGWKMTAMAASFLLILQSVSIMMPKEDPGYVPLSSGCGPNQANKNRLSIRFVDGATHLQIQELLLKHQLNIICGPSAIGLYVIESNQLSDEILNQLKQHSDVIDYVQKN